MESLLSPIEQHVVDFVLKLRTTKHQSQEQIGFIIGASKSFISKVENRKHRAKYNFDHIARLADHFGISPKDFFPEKATL